MAELNMDNEGINIRVNDGRPEVRLSQDGPWEKVRTYSVFRRVEGDHICILSDDEVVLCAAGSADVEGTIKNIPIERDLLMVDRGEGTEGIPGRYVFYQMSREEIRGFLIATKGHDQAVPIRPLSTTECASVIFQQIGGQVKGVCYSCGNPPSDACSYCGRPMCARHTHLCVVSFILSHPAFSLGFCDECLYWFLGIRPKTDQKTTVAKGRKMSRPAVSPSSGRTSRS